MVLRGHVQNGVVVLDEPQALPEGATVRIEIISGSNTNAPRPPRVGGQWKGQVHIAEDFDELPDDLADALGVKVP
ncbi:MAG: hypothetical protein SFV23_14005 [Planctomycetaceae bacterium]|nr:hypothetical protein [Planctomycetaceae bacterium]